MNEPGLSQPLSPYDSPNRETNNSKNYSKQDQHRNDCVVLVDQEAQERKVLISWSLWIQYESIDARLEEWKSQKFLTVGVNSCEGEVDVAVDAKPVQILFESKAGIEASIVVARKLLFVDFDLEVTRFWKLLLDKGAFCCANILQGFVLHHQLIKILDLEDRRQESEFLPEILPFFKLHEGAAELFSSLRWDIVAHIP